MSFQISHVKREVLVICLNDIFKNRLIVRILYSGRKVYMENSTMDRLITHRMRFSLHWMEGEQELSAIAPKSLTLLAFCVEISGVPATKERLKWTTTFSITNDGEDWHPKIWHTKKTRMSGQRRDNGICIPKFSNRFQLYTQFASSSPDEVP